MSKIIEFTDGEDPIFVEVDSFSGYQGTVEVSSSNDLVVKSTKKFSEALSTVKNISHKVIDSISGMTVRPDEIELKLGIKFSAEAGVVVAKTSTEGNIELTVKWNAGKINENV